MLAKILFNFDSSAAVVLALAALVGTGAYFLMPYLVGWLSGSTLGNVFTRLSCWVRRFFRRSSWFLLFPSVVVGYYWFYGALLYAQTRGLVGAEQEQAVAALAAKMVDPTQFYSKSGIAISNFCLINALGWGSLIVVPVLIDWATGYYKKPQLNFPTTRGFKGTFLFELTGWQRILIFVGIWGLELAIAAHAVDSAFRMQ